MQLRQTQELIGRVACLPVGRIVRTLSLPLRLSEVGIRYLDCRPNRIHPTSV